MKGKISLRVRIFFSMILLTIFSLVLIVVATYFQYFAQNDDYNNRRLIRKETQVKNHLFYILNRDNAFDLSKEKQSSLYDVFESISLIHKVEYALYSLDGIPYFYSYMKLGSVDQSQVLNSGITQELFKSKRKRITIQNEKERGKFQYSYSVLFNKLNEPYGILYFPYFEDVSFSSNESSAPCDVPSDIPSGTQSYIPCDCPGGIASPVSSMNHYPCLYFWSRRF